jgi:hypothetical protein
MFDKFDSLVDELAVAKAKFSREAKLLLQDAFNEMFMKYQFVHAFRWTQFTPYFNDGEPCVFRVYELTYSIGPNTLGLPTGEYAGDYEDGFLTEYYLRVGEPCTVTLGSGYSYIQRKFPSTVVEEFVKDVAALQSKMSQLADMLQDVYGDHVQVTVYASGTTDVDEYDHE